MSTNEPGAPNPYEPRPGEGQPGQSPPPGGQPEQPGGATQQPGAAGTPQYGQAPQPSPYAAGGVPQSAYPGSQYPMQPYPKNGLGVWSLVLGIVSWLVCPIIASIAAIITGHMSRRAVREGQADNGGMALAGIILGWASLILAVVAIIIIFVVLGVALNDPDFQELIENPPTNY